MKKTVSVVLLIVMCCVFAPLNALASDSSVSANGKNSSGSESSISAEESIRESIHTEKVAMKESRSAGSAPEVSRPLPDSSDDSNRFSIGWTLALVGLVGAGVGVYIYNRRK